MKKLCFTLALLLALCRLLCSCKAVNDPVSSEAPADGRISISVGVTDRMEKPNNALLGAEQQTDVTQDEKYDAVLLNISIDDFLKAGFQFGDSCDIVFSNGLSYEDIPFYNGYYVRTGLPLIVGYPGYKFIAVTCNNAGLWTKAGLKNGDSATVTVREAGKYADVQETLSQSYSDDRAAYADDVTFANFRVLSGGNLKENLLFRGASPVDNTKNRAPYADRLLQANEISFILDLADAESDINGYFAEEDFCSAYAKKLYLAGNIALLDMSSNYGTDTYKQKLATGLRQMLGAKGKIYIHCLEGKDRTGFVCMLLEALAGASYEEMLADYMTTYANYYGISGEQTPKKYAAVVDLYFNAFASCLHGTEDIDILKSADYIGDAEKYLRDGGMTQAEIGSLKRLICR